MHVDAAREHVVAACVDLAWGLHVAAQLRDEAVAHADVAHALAAGGYERAAAHDQIEHHRSYRVYPGHVTLFNTLASNDWEGIVVGCFAAHHYSPYNA